MLKRRLNNPRYPHKVRILRTYVVESINPFKESEEREGVVYEGVGRSYTDTTTTGDKKVDYNKRKVVMPMRFDDWEEVYPEDGDVVEVEIGNIKERGMVKDFEGDNQRSIVYWEYLRN